MEEQIAKQLNANNGNSCFSASELKLLTDYFCTSDNETSSEEEDTAQLHGKEEVSVTSDADTVQDVPPEAKSRKLMQHDFENDSLTSAVVVNESTLSTVGEFSSSGVQLSSVAASDDIYVEIEQFKCNCKLGVKGQSCYEMLDEMLILQQKLSCLEIDYYNNDSVNYLNEHIIAKIDAICSDSNVTKKSHSKNNERQRVKCTFSFHGHRVCQTTFLFLHNIGKKRWKNLMKRWQSTGIELHCHGNKGRGNKTQLEAKDVIDVVKFIDNFAATNAMILPGRVPAFKDPDLKLLPSCMPKSTIHRKFLESAKESSVRLISYRTFCRIWKTYRGNIRIQNPRTDLCSVCTENQLSLGAMGKLSDVDKLNLLKRSSDHLVHADKERQEYKRQISDSRASIQLHSSSLKMERHDYCTFNGTNHYSFDYAQQVHIPSSAEQVGALYFLTPYKVAIFGIQCDPLSKQINYLIPECAVTGKGANQVVSYVHDFLETNGLGEKHAYFHGDNCCAQNKNNMLMGYFLWRVLNNMNETITMSFLPVGHTKFSPDPAFGILKAKFRRSTINNLNELVQVVNDSTPESKLNEAKLVGDTSGNIFVPAYNWQQHFQEFGFKNIPNIKIYHKFVFSNLFKGRVRLFESSYSLDYTEFIVINNFESSCLPSILLPVGLSEQRKLYLFNSIRPFVAERSKDLLCPKPTPSFDQSPHFKVPSSPVQTKKSLPEVVRASPKCGFCGKIGHRNSILRGKFTCPERLEQC